MSICIPNRNFSTLLFIIEVVQDRAVIHISHPFMVFTAMIRDKTLGAFLIKQNLLTFHNNSFHAEWSDWSHVMSAYIPGCISSPFTCLFVRLDPPSLFLFLRASGTLFEHVDSNSNLTFAIFFSYCVRLFLFYLFFFFIHWKLLCTGENILPLIFKEKKINLK